MDRLRTTNVLLTLIAVVLVGAAFRAAEPVFIALLLSVLLVYVLDPLVIQLQRLRLPLWAATIIAAVALVGVVGGLGFFVVRDLLELGTRFPEYQERILAMVAARHARSRRPWVSRSPSTCSAACAGSPSAPLRSRPRARSRPSPSTSPWCSSSR